jgi:hypothetical protein
MPLDPHGNRIFIALFSSQNPFQDIIAPPCLESVARIEHFLMEVSRLRIERASLRKAPAISGALPTRMRLLSSLKVTASGQCNEFSMPQ